METKIIEQEDVEGITYKIFVTQSTLEANLYFNFYTPDFYILFYNSGELYFPGEESIFHAKTWEVLKQHVNINLRDYEFQNFIGILNHKKVKEMIKILENEYEKIKKKEENPLFYALS